MASITNPSTDPQTYPTTAKPGSFRPRVYNGLYPSNHPSFRERTAKARVGSMKQALLLPQTETI